MPKWDAVVCDRIFATTDIIKKQERKKQQKQSDMTTATPPITSPPTHKKTQPTLNTNTNKDTTHMQPKDRQVPVISKNNTSKKKKKQKKVIPPKTAHEIKRTIVTADEVNQYLQQVQNNPDLDEFPMNNLMIRTQIAECEVAYYKIWHTDPVLAEVDMEYYHSLPPVQILLGGDDKTRKRGNVT